METANRRVAIQKLSSVPGYADGGFISTLKRAVGIQEDSPELKAYKLKSEQERQAAKTAPQPAPQAQPQAQPASTQPQPQPAQPLQIDYQGPAPLGRQSVIDGRMKAAGQGLSTGGPVEGPGGPTEDKVPLMGSAGEFMIKAASAKIIGRRVLNALNALADLPAPKAKAKAMPVGHYAAGGEIEDDPKRVPQVSIQSTDPMGMQTGGSEMVNASRTRSTVDALADIGKTIVSAPGYGMSPIARRPAAPTAYPAGAVAPDSSPASANPSQPLPVSPAGAGRGFVNPPTVTPQRDMSFITPAAAPQGAAATLASTPRITDQAGLDAIQGRQDAGDRAYAAKRTAEADVANANAINQWQADQTIQGAAMKGNRNALQILTGNLVDRTNRRGQDQSTQTTQRGQDITAKTTERGQDVNAADNTARNGIARDRLSMDAKGSELDNQAKAAMLQAQRNLAAARTPEEKVAAEDTLRALQGKYEKAAPPEQYGFAPGGQETDPTTGQTVTRPGVIFNKATGQTVAPQAAKPATNFVVGKVYVDGKGQKAKWDGKQFVPA